MPRTREQLERLYADLTERGDAYLVRSDGSHQIQMEQAVKLQNLLTVRNLFPREVWKSAYQRELQRYDNAKATYEELDAALPMIWAERRKVDLELEAVEREEAAQQAHFEQEHAAFSSYFDWEGHH